MDSSETVGATASTNKPELPKQQLPWYRKLDQNKTLLLVLVSMAQMLDLINVASVTIVLPDIMKDVGYKVEELQWVSSAYALTYGGFLLVGGRLGDLFGHRRIFILGLAWFSIWSVVNGFVRTPVTMSISRALQGPERTKALAVFGGSAALGSVIGVLFGGIFGSTIGWEWIFYITAIVGCIFAALGLVVIPAEKGISHVEDRRLDYVGMCSFTVGIVAVIYYLSEGPGKGWTKAITLAPFLAGLVLLFVFVAVEYKIDYPIMPLRIWRSRRLVASCLCICANSATLNSFVYFSSLTFQQVQGHDALKTSLFYIVQGVGCIAISLVVLMALKRIRTKIILIVGWFFLIGCCVLFAQIKADSSYWSIAFPALILNFMGLVPIWACCQINSVADAADEDQGVVGAVYNVALQVGGPIGIAVANIIANDRNPAMAFGPALLPGYHAAFYASAVMGGIGLVLSIIFASNNDPPRTETEEELSQDFTKLSGDKESVHYA
ncbi:hypothetical protein BGZ72_000848 [Mortierella alpina]|nr:hypothetical protein BGZ72_000848 [Mortierella alpina]